MASKYMQANAARFAVKPPAVVELPPSPSPRALPAIPPAVPCAAVRRLLAPGSPAAAPNGAGLRVPPGEHQQIPGENGVLSSDLASAVPATSGGDEIEITGGPDSPAPPALLPLACNSERIWLSAYGSWMCAGCHPAKHPSQARVVARLSVDWEAGDVGGAPVVGWRDMASGEFLDGGGEGTENAADPASHVRKNFPVRTPIEQKFLEKIFPPVDDDGEAVMSVDDWWRGEMSLRTKLIDEIAAGGYKAGADGVVKWPENRK